MTRVKICGITTAEDRDVAIAAGADAIGVTVAVTVDSPREITAERAAILVSDVPPFVTTVLVTMPAEPIEALDLAASIGVDAIQLHGDYTPKQLEPLSSSTRGVILAADAARPDEARRYASFADALLVDSTRERGGGGTGRTHDWETTRSLRESLDVPVILAGGLTPDNVGRAVRTVEPFAVDVASGVERTGGRKDHEAVEAFVNSATRALEAVR